MVKYEIIKEREPTIEDRLAAADQKSVLNIKEVKYAAIVWQTRI